MTDDSAPAAIPWYKSTVLRGILTIIVTQVVNSLQSRYHIDTDVLGLSVNQVVAWAMDAISGLALAYMAHGRVTQKTAPAITVSQNKADLVNAATSPPGAPDALPVTPPSTGGTG